MTILRRTFEAAKHPAGSPERARLNLRAETSEYMTSYKYMILEYGPYVLFRTKKKALAYTQRQRAAILAGEAA